MFSMLTANALAEFSSDTSALRKVKVKLRTRVVEVEEVSLGYDLVLGRCGESLYLLPLGSILEISGVEQLPQLQLDFEQILTNQQQPVMIHYHLPETPYSAWPLGVSIPWLRLAHPRGVIWVPISGVECAENKTPGQSSAVGNGE
jgi:hypothetical protein